MKQNKFGELQPVSNAHSRHRTTTTVMHDLHWETMRLDHIWTWERYVRLARFLQYTPWELASFVMMPHSAVDRFQARGRLECAGQRHIALILTIVEAHILAGWTTDTIKNPFPKIPEAADDHARPKSP